MASQAFEPVSVTQDPPAGVSPSVWREYLKAREALTGNAPVPLASLPSRSKTVQRLKRGKSATGQSNGRAKGPNSPLPPKHTETITSWPKSEEREKQKQAGEEAEPLPERGVPEPVKERMVELFAQFQSVGGVAKSIKAEFGLALDLRTVETYNPSSRLCRIGKRLRALHDAIRKEYVERSADVALAHQAHRLRLIGDIVEKATTAKDFGNAIKGLELAAKEMGGALEGKTIVTHTGAVAHVHGSVDDMRQELAMRLATVVEAMPPVSLPAPSPDATPEAVATEGVAP